MWKKTVRYIPLIGLLSMAVCICTPNVNQNSIFKITYQLTTSLPPRMVADALWLLTARSRGGNHWVSNANAHIHSVDIAGNSYPVSLLDHSDWKESYVSSPRSTWLRYARSE